MPCSLASLLLTAAFASAIPVSSSLWATPAHAQSTPGLRAAADEYRDAARHFERHVESAGYFNHYDRRLADRLEDVAGDFRSAARDPHDTRRLLYHWSDLTSTHVRVETVLVHGCSHPDPHLLQCWQPVVDAYACLVAEMHCYTHGRHSHGYQRPYISGRPPVDPYPAFPSYGYPHALPYGSPSYGSASQYRPSTPPFQGSRGFQIESRRDVGAAVAATILNRLFN